MGYIEKWKVFFNKEDFDYSEGLIDPYEFHKTFYVFLKLFRVLDNETLPKWTIITPILVTFCGSGAAVMCFIGLIHNIQILDVPLMTESGTYLIIMLYKLFILSSTKLNLPAYHSFLRALKYDFLYICTIGSKYRQRFFANHLTTFKASVLAAIFTASIAGGMIVCANISLIFYIVNNDPRKGDDKPLPFPFWLFDLNLNQSPLYDIFFVFSNMCVLSHSYTYIFMMQTQIVWVRQVTSKADVIIWSIQDLLIDVQPSNTLEEEENYTRLVKFRMRHIIKMHQSMYRLLDDYAAVYKKFLMFEQKFAGPVVCLTAYCAAEKLDSGEIKVILFLLCVSVVVLVFIPSYLCTFLAYKVQSVSDACWDAPFWNAGPVVRPYLVLTMQRAMRPLPIQAAGFEDVSLQTYSNKMTSAYSCFNMLRQANFDI